MVRNTLQTSLLILLLLPAVFCFGKTPLRVTDFRNNGEMKIPMVGKYVKATLDSQIRAVERFDVGATNGWHVYGVVEKLNITSGGFSSMGIGGYQYVETTIEIVFRVTGGRTNFVVRESASEKLTGTDLIIKESTRSEDFRDYANRIAVMDALSDGFPGTIVGRTISSIVEKAAWRISLRILGKPYGYQPVVTDVRNEFVYFKNERSVGFSPWQEFVVRNAAFTNGAIAEPKKCRINALVGDSVELSVPGHLFKSGDKIILY